ncbi:MAG TPA: lysophospholipase [Solirubrobacteraceae bacterium]|nr:lysophospholipase [Solirubrobacteraceae bacterium]
MIHLEGRFTGVGDREIYWQAWLPESGQHTSLVIAHGASEHGGRYGHVVETLVPAGYGVYAIDHRGHGRSGGRRAVIDRLTHAVADLDTLIDRVTGEDESKPYLLGHSMGGCIAIAYALEHQDKLAGLMLSAPLAIVEASAPQRAVVRVLSALAPGLGVAGIDTETISRDPEQVRAYELDPLVFHGKLQARTAVELADATASFPERLPSLTLPLLVMHGGADRLVPPASGELVYSHAGSTDKTLKLYEGFYHELFNEPQADRDRALDDLSAWLGERVGRVAMGSSEAYVQHSRQPKDRT